jgi:hypothetical protein
MEMKLKVLKHKSIYKAHKAQLKHEIRKLRAKAAGIAEKASGRKLLAAEEKDDFLEAEELESGEEDGHKPHHQVPAKCHSCHAACYKNCAAQYFGPKLMENTVSGTMCMDTKTLNSFDTIKTAMDGIGNLDYILGGQHGLQAFGLLLPASLSFLSAVLKSSKLVKKLLPQSRLAGYLIVLAAMSNVPILAAFIATGYQAIGDVFYCLGTFSFLCTFFVFFLNTESLVRSQSHEEAHAHIDKRGKMTFVFFGLAGIFLGVFAWEHQAAVRQALHLPLTMLIIKKVCDFLGRTMFTLVTITDVLLLLFHKLYGDEGDKLDQQEFMVPLSQVKRLFLDRDALIERLEEEEQ